MNIRAGVYNPQTGQIIRVVGCPEQHLNLQIDHETEAALILTDDIGMKTHYVNVDASPHTFVAIPESPSEFHDWDPIDKAWVLSVERMRFDLLDQISYLFIIKKHLPILHDSKTMDADQTAMDNIAGKLKEIEILGLNYPTDMLLWRDANNDNHSWPDVESYKTFLEGLVVAISQRTTRLYLDSWQKKAEIDALDSLNIASYDVEQGWSA